MYDDAPKREKGIGPLSLHQIDICLGQNGLAQEPLRVSFLFC